MNILKKVMSNVGEKIGRSKIVKNPVFLVIGLIVLVAIIVLIYFIFLKYSPIMNFKYGGYAISGKEVTENLLGSSGDEENGANKNIELTKIEEQGTIFKKLNSFFVGDKNKTEINLEYPIYINENSAIYNLSEETTLISKDFEEISGYPNLSISEGKVYDGNNLERADGKEYIFVKTSEGIYINLQEIKLKTVVNEYTIPVNSIIAFSENGIRYYSVKNNVLVFNEIKDVDNNTNVQIVENNYTYKDLLTRLGIIKETPQNNENTNEQESGEQEVTANSENKDENNEENEQNENTDNSENNTENTNNTADNNQDAYIKPEVSCEEFTVEVYTATSTLHINDPAGRIIEAPTFEIYKDGKIYLRRVYTNSGTIQITGLLPDTEYEIKGKYIYLNENGQKIENQFYEGKFTTKGYDALGSIDIQKENGEIYSNKIQIQKVKITSDLNAEVLKGVNQVEIVTGDIRTVLKNNQINELLQGKEITIESSEGLQSNSKIDYEIKFYDRNGVELKVNNNKGETRTSKQEPEVRVSIKEQNIVSVTLNLRLTNKDNVKLENYKYIVTKPNGEKVREEKLAENEKELLLEDLDQNQYYTIKIYADFDLNDNRGKQENVEIGSLVFATQPISTLGSLDLNVENKELTGNSSTIDYTINEDRTDKRLIQILNELTIKIVEQPSNTNDSSNNENNINTNAVDEGNSENKVAENDTSINKTNKEPIVVYTNTLTGDEITNLQQGNTKEIRYENLKSNTRYTIEITGEVKLGETEESIPITYTYKEFITLKIPAKVEIKNQFVTGNLIDFDVRIEDVDKSVLNEKVRMELRDEKDNLIDLQEITTNQDFIRKTYEKLEEKKTYKLSFYADQYNEGSTDETYKVNYLIKEIEIVTEPGISGQVGLTELTRKAVGKNLVDMSSETKWYVYPNFNIYDYYGKEYDQQTKVLTLGGHGNSRRAVYDLREYAGQEVTMSFKAKNVNGSQNTYIQNSKTDTNRTKIDGLTNEWKDFQYTLTIDSTGYLGFYINGGNGIQIKELQIELGDKKTSYEEYKYTLESKYSINLEDKRDEITTNDYYIKIYEDGNLVKTDRYEEIPESNIITNAIKTYDTESGKDYKVELAIKVNDREYTISNLEYNTNDTEEIKGIYNKEDFLEIQPKGHYIVLGDIDLSGGNGYQYTFGTDRLPFEGTIDFNGHSLTRDSKNKTNAIIEYIAESGVIENLVLNIKLNNTIESNIIGFNAYNYGMLKNIKLNVIEANNLPNVNLFLLNRTNYGNIENFAVNFMVPIYVQRSMNIISYENYGTIKNGYVYGENTKAIYDTLTDRNIGIIAQFNKKQGVIKNIYNLTSIELNSEQKDKDTISNILVYSESQCIMQNVYSVGTGSMSGAYKGPNIYGSSSGTKNSYYFSDKIFNTSDDIKTTPLALYDTKFQEQVLNEDGMFDIDELIKKEYYPHIKWPECMPSQDYISLPEVQDKDLPDLLSTTVLEQGTESAKVKFVINNPNAETITKIVVKNLNCQIESQEYKDGKTEVIALLDSPIICTSDYSLELISTKGAYGLGYDRTYLDKERIVPIELYREIHTIDDWKGIEKSPTENYILMEDLDFKNLSEDESYLGITYTGKFNGNNHTIKNITSMTPHPWSAGLLYTLSGELKNLNIENFNYIGSINETNTSNGYYAGLIGQVMGIVDNVHVNNVNIHIDGKCNCRLSIGGIVSEIQSGLLRNSSVSNINVYSTVVCNDLNVGALSGVGNNGFVENSYAQNIKIQVLNSPTATIGGLIGWGSNISSCYAIGDIITDATNYVAGIEGRYSSVTNSYCKVNIEGQGNIFGIGNGSAANNTKNLSIGNLYSKSNTSNIYRICEGEPAGNYAYKNQKINGFIKDDEQVSLIDDKDLRNKDTYIEKIKLGTNFDYTQVNEGILPKLYNTSGTELLPNQIDNKISETSNFQIEDIQYQKINSNAVEVRITVNNANNLDIEDVVIEDMNTNITKIQNQNNKTYITLTATPTRYYDSYKLEKIEYQDGNEIKEEAVDAKIELQFFKELYTFNDWQSIEVGTYQNYKLMQDIDFTGMNDIKTNVTLGRLESNGYALKNMNVKLSNSTSGIINNVLLSFKGVKFENITVENDTNASYIGIINSNTAETDNISFENIKILAPQSDYISLITNNYTKVTNINIKDITITGRNYVAGLVQTLSGSDIDKVNMDGVTISASGNYVGGVIAYSYGDGNDVVSNVTINNADISGRDYIGGVAGNTVYTKIDGANISNSNISGHNMIGGLMGDTSWLADDVIIDNVKVSGNNYIGGIFGRTHDQRSSNNFKVMNSNIIGQNNVGGIIGGLNSSTLSEIYLKNTNIKATGDNVGGISGDNRGGIITIGVVENGVIEGNSNVGGVNGNFYEGKINNLYVNAEIIANGTNCGGIVGYLENEGMTASSKTSQVFNSYVVSNQIVGKNNVGGIFGNISTTLYMPDKFYYGIYVQADINSGDLNSTSLGIGGMSNQNQYLKDTYYYKYSSINGENPTTQNEVFIPQDNYLIEENLKQQTTYTSKLKWSTTYWNFDVLSNGKYPIINSNNLTDQKGIDIPKDAEHIIGSSGINMMSLDENKEQTQEETLETTEMLEQSFEYEGKEIQTYSTYSVVKSEDGSSVRRNAKLYVKNNTLYAVPTVLSMSEDLRTNSESDSNNSSNNKVIPVANNLILDSYNGKEYETVLGSDGRIYDLKEPINYPENFVNKDIESIGNNLNSDTKEIEVTYKNGDKLKFNYQTGEVIESSKNTSEQKGLFEYIKEKLGDIGDSVGTENEEIRNKYKESKELQSKLEETPVEEAMEEQSREIDNNNGKNIENNNSGANAENSNSETNIDSQGNTNSNLGNTASVATTETNSANNSNTEKRYISMYNEETGNYEIYDERELLDTTKEEVVSENEKIEANNLNKYYASEGNTKNRSMGILWIVLSIIGIGIILFVLKKNLKKKN